MDRTALLRARVPRYTSYPPIPLWRPDPDPARIDRALAEATTPAEVYVHVPFCHSQCSYCGCTMVVSRSRTAGERYLAALRRHVARMPLPRGRLPLRRLHLGGGTPTWLTPAELGELMGILRLRFSFEPGAELSIEAAPHATRVEHVEALAGLGFTRLSLGVQSFDPTVLAEVDRPPAAERVAVLLARARDLGMRGLNLDLMRGLPGQSLESLRATLEHAIRLHPDRLAVFGYAHVPHLKAHQGKLDASKLPDGPTRQAMAELCREVLESAGYQAIGLDHFARPDDPLAIARRAGTLHRNFMGYTPRAGSDMIGLGMSAISEVAGVFWQDESKLGRWLQKVDAARSLATRAWVMTAEDRLRRDVITTLLCNGRVDLGRVAERHGRELSVFAPERARLRPFVDNALATDTDGVITVPDDAIEALRPLAAVFDAYRGRGGRYSLAV